jgi:hypothetical protein
MLQHGDIVGTDHAGRTVLQLAVDPWTLDQLCAFDAGAEDLEDTDSEPEPDQEYDGPAILLDFVPPKRLRRATRMLQALALASVVVTASQIEARADQGTVVAPLPMSTAQAPQQCCRICRKGQACGDGCISAAKQCRAPAGCACSAGSGS